MQCIRLDIVGMGWVKTNRDVLSCCNLLGYPMSVQRFSR